MYCFAHHRTFGPLTTEVASRRASPAASAGSFAAERRPPRSPGPLAPSAWPECRHSRPQRLHGSPPGSSGASSGAHLRSDGTAWASWWPRRDPWLSSQLTRGGSRGSSTGSPWGATSERSSYASCSLYASVLEMVPGPARVRSGSANWRSYSQCDYCSYCLRTSCCPTSTWVGPSRPQPSRRLSSWSGRGFNCAKMKV